MRTDITAKIIEGLTVAANKAAHDAANAPMGEKEALQADAIELRGIIFDLEHEEYLVVNWRDI